MAGHAETNFKSRFAILFLRDTQRAREADGVRARRYQECAAGVAAPAAGAAAWKYRDRERDGEPDYPGASRMCV
jgi:hypothetical protein